MRSDDDKHPAGHGHAWRGDWNARLAALLSAQGWQSVTQFLADGPGRSTVELAQALGGGDVAGVQLEWVAIDEAKASGDIAIERCARDLLVRSLHAAMPNGWDPDDERADARAFSSWATNITGPGEMPDPAQGGSARWIAAPRSPLDVWTALADAVPPGWLPSDADDPILVEVFRAHWQPAKT